MISNNKNRTEQEIKQKLVGCLFAAGCDEVGAGVLFGDLVVAAVILNPKKIINGLTDSKKLSEIKREQLYPQIIESALDYCIIHISAPEVDSLNIYQARMEGFRRCLGGLKKVDYAVIDGNKVPSGLKVEADYFIKGDLHIQCISAASIIAKVTRDRDMVEFSKIYPHYGFESHKGYCTKEHLGALKKHGPIEKLHRFSYRPVRDSIKK